MRSIAALCAAVLLAGTARADDACLTGVSTLGDQRALAALAAATESACPCADATSGKAWRRCARGVLDQTTDAGGLRASSSVRGAPWRPGGSRCEAVYGGSSCPW